MHRLIPYRLAFWLTLFLAVNMPVRAVEQIDLELGEIETDFLRAEGISLRIVLSDTADMALVVEVADLQIPELGLWLKNVRWDCPSLQLQQASYSCDKSRLVAKQTSHGPVIAQMVVHYQQADSWQLKLDRLEWAGGVWSGTWTQENSAWNGRFSSTGVKLEMLASFPPLDSLMSAYQVAGELALTCEFSGDTKGLTQLVLQGGASELSYANDTASQAAEGLALSLEAAGRRTQHGWDGDVKGRLHQGQLYSEPIFLEVGVEPLEFSSTVDWVAPQQQLHVVLSSLQLPDVLNLSGELTLDLARGVAADYRLEYGSAKLGEVYSVFLRPWFIGTAVDSLSVDGSVRGEIKGGVDGLHKAHLRLEKVHVADQQMRFGLSGLEGEMNWQRGIESRRSRLRVEGGHLYQVGFGGFVAEIDAVGNALALHQPLAVPVLDGVLTLQDLQASGLVQDPVQWQMAARVEGIDLKHLSESLGWPLVEGALYGHIPKVYYRDRKLGLDGLLTMDVFGGRVTVEGLDILDPLGIVPVLETTLYFSDLDLGQLTNTFSFGRIEGLLEGRVGALQLVGWELNRFHAKLATPEGDRSRRRISQRAVDNLTEIGNGISANLSQTFLRYFKDFGYERIFLEIDLSQNVAVLDGLPAPNDGYYIVKGSGLPRIDVIGRNRKVAWKDLVARLKEIQLDAVVIK